MRKIFTALVCLALYLPVIAQEGEYRSKSNPLYWKNRMPDAAYWQQDVAYRIDAKIDEETNVISASETLDYWNNSPDTLPYVYFHLWQNAFVKGSHLHELESALKVKTKLGKYEKQGLGITIDGLKVSGKEAKTELDNTILKVYLDKPLYPGGKVSFTMSFKTYYDNGSTRRRMQMWDAWGFKHYNGVQWFPKICVYDRKFGWDTHQHLNKEFYSDYGSYDVKLDFASNYIVEATGLLVNRKEALPDDLRAKLDVKNFKDKKWDEKPSEIIPYVKGERKSWHYKALNVHDFAFTADPSYRLSTANWHGIECVGIVQEPHASGWQESGELVAKIVKSYSEHIGMYQYPKMVAADARDGMEYPMLTLDGGKEPGYRSLLVHEIGHNWFYGQVGNNETYRAAMDEGFTQFIESECMRRMDGENIKEDKPKSFYRRWFYEPTNTQDRLVLNNYVSGALNKDEVPLNTHSNDFSNALAHEGGYRQVYFKSASMLSNLQYTLGDSLFKAAFSHYFDQWRFAHPYFEDFRSSIIQYTHVDLNWFFDQWLETTKTIDYGICGIHKIAKDSFEIKFHRSGLMQMPLDFTVTNKNGAKRNFHIPNTWFEKKTDAIVLPKWYGWDKLHDTYTARIQSGHGVRSVQIDTTYRLADMYMLDNYKTRGLPISPKAIKIRLDGGLNNPTDRKHKRVYLRPDVWYNMADGIKLGVHVESDYFNTINKVDGAVWFNTHMLQTADYQSFKSQGWYDKYVALNYTFNYSSPLTRNTPKLLKQLNTRWLDGLWYHRAGLTWLAKGNNTFNGNVQIMWRPLSYDKDYLIYRDEWSSGKNNLNTSVNASWAHSYSYKRGTGNYKFSIRAPFLTGNSAAAFNYSYAQFESINNNKLGKLEVKTRLFGRLGTGTNLPYESLLWAAGANPEELMENKYTRNNTVVPKDWRSISASEIGHIQQGGGLNLRGYAGYLIVDDRNGNTLVGYKGRSGASASIEVDFENYFKFRPRFIKDILHLDAYVFADAGAIELSNASVASLPDMSPTTMWSDLRLDAGLGFALTIKKFGPFEKARPLTLRFDMPFFINRPPAANPEYTAFRWVVGINRCF